MEFKILIEDQALLAGIEYARQLSNASRNEDEQFKTDQEYISWVLTEAAASYARDKLTAEKEAAIAAAEVGDFTKLEVLLIEWEK